MSMSGYDKQQQENEHVRCPGCEKVEARLRELEAKINQWEDRAGFLRTIMLAASMTIGIIVSAIEWIRTHIAIK